MARGLYVFLLFTIIGAYTWQCMALPVPLDGIRIQQGGPEAAWPGVYPESIVVIGGTYAGSSNGVYTADGTYNDRPVYKLENGGWSIYYRKSGYWVTDFNAVSEDWDGTVGIQKTLFPSEV